MDRALHKYVYRLIVAADWSGAQRRGVVPYAEHDRRDGFLHLSTRAQVLETAQRYFTGRTDVLALEIDANALGANLRFEPVRDDETFPHLYGELPVASVISAHPLALCEDGAFAFGDGGGE